MKKIFLLLSVAFSLTQLSAQTYMEQFKDLFSAKDSVGQVRLLEKWEKENSGDPELYVANFNFYFTESEMNVITLGTDPKGKEALKIESKDSTMNQLYMYDAVMYHPATLQKAFDWIDKGIQKFPSRLDMRFGKTHACGLVEDYEEFTAEIVKIIEYSKVNDNNWTWSNNEKLKGGEQRLLSSLQDYILTLYNTQNDALLENMKTISETVLKHYPDHVESLSNLSIVYILQKDYDKALEPLFKAEKINPKDYIVLSNIAQAYKLKGDKKNAIKYYELVTKHGDEDAKEYAKGQIKELKK